MSTAKALTPAEIEKVLNHIEQNSNASMRPANTYC